MKLGQKSFNSTLNIEIPVVYRFLQSIKDVSRKITIIWLKRLNTCHFGPLMDKYLYRTNTLEYKKD